MLNYLSRRREQERKQQQEFIAHEIHDGTCQYTAAAQMMFDAFRREQTDTWSGDWSSFDMGLEFLNHANEELRRNRCMKSMVVAVLSELIPAETRDMVAANMPAITNPATPTGKTLTMKCGRT